MNIKGQSGKNISILLMMFVLSCTSTPDIALQQNIANTPTPYPSSTNTTVAPSPVATLSPTPTIQIKDGCLSLEESLPSDFQFEGVWVRQESKPYLENLVENTKYRVPLDGGGRLGNYWMDLSTSPDGQWLAYLDAILDTSGRAIRMEGLSLKVIHSSGYFLSMDYWPISMQSIQGWVDDKNLLLELGQRSIVLNPFSGGWYEIKDPDWLSSLTVDKPWWYEIKRYSPHLDTVTVKLDNHSELRNLISNKNLFGDASLGFFKKSSWSSDGTMLAVATNGGNVVNLFHDNSKFLEVKLSKAKIGSSLVGGFISEWDNLAWSQNNKFLLIDTNSSLHVLNVEDTAIHNICFIDPNIYKTSKNSFFYLSDGNYIVIPVYKRNQDYSYEYFDILVDIEGAHAYRLPTSKYNGRISWLALPDSTEK